MDDTLDFLIGPDGETVSFVYSDLAHSLFPDEEHDIRRASHVEPASSVGWEADGWVADMRPSGGPILFEGWSNTGVKLPFTRRTAALDAEREWLRANKFL